MNFYGNDDSSDDDNVLDDYKGKNGILFLIDFREEMFELDPVLGKSYFRLSLSTCKTVMKEIARSGKDDLMGVSLVGTERGSSDGSPLGDIAAFGSVSAKAINLIDETIVDNGDIFKDKYGQTDKGVYLNLVKILNGCCRIFKDFKTKIYSKTLVLLTNDDDPLLSDQRLAHSVLKQANRLSHAAIDLVVVGLGQDFHHNKFYNEMISLARGEFDKDWRNINRVKKLKEIDIHLLNIMSRLSRTNRDLILNDDVSLPISLYKLYKEPKVKFKRKVIRREEEEVSANDLTANMASSSKQQDKVPLIGGKIIEITRSQLSDADIKMEIGLTLIGFMPSQDIPEYLTVKPPRVMLPNYFSQDCIKAFACILDRCREEKLSMLCWYKYNRNNNIALIACHPMPHQVGSACPDGFCVVTLPFSDNYSDPDYKKLDAADPSDKQIEAAKTIVKKLSVGFTTETFHDCELQRTMAMMEALALDYDQIEAVADDTLFDDESLDNPIAAYTEDFNDCSHLGPMDSLGAMKRPGDQSSYRATKNPRMSSIDGILEIIKEGKAETLTVALLKQALDSKGIYFPPSSKKPQLVNLVNLKIK